MLIQYDDTIIVQIGTFQSKNLNIQCIWVFLRGVVGEGVTSSIDFLEDYYITAISYSNIIIVLYSIIILP